jgi:hypothetical protein
MDWELLHSGTAGIDDSAVLVRSLLAADGFGAARSRAVVEPDFRRVGARRRRTRVRTIPPPSKRLLVAGGVRARATVSQRFP